MKKITILGSTGSVGQNALEVLRAHQDKFRVVGLAAGSNEKLLKSQIAEFSPEAVALADAEASSRLSKELPSGVKLYSGPDGSRELVLEGEADLLVAASSGSTSLFAVLDAIEKGTNIAIANKEILVMAGRILTEAATKHGVKLLPVDSEHNAIFQCLEGQDTSQVRHIFLTGSGGPLKDVPKEDFKGLSPEVAVRHPKWNMGKKISVDSATMMNKGLEIIEARWLFGISPQKIQVWIHPEAMVHSMVEFVDGSILAQMGPTDMKLPLLHVLGYPDRVDYPDFSTSFADLNALHFSKPDFAKFPCLKYAMDVAEKGDTTQAAVLNAADECAVEAFLDGRIDFTEIPEVIEKLLTSHRIVHNPSLEEILQADEWARQEATRWTNKVLTGS